MKVMRKIDSSYEDKGRIYELKFIKIEPPTKNFYGCIVYKLDDGNSWNFNTLNVLLNESLIDRLEKESYIILEN